MPVAHLISAENLSYWACEHSATADLPWFVRRLVRLTVGHDARIEFATGRGIYQRGFDGIVDCNGVGNVPDGFSVWEVSTDQDFEEKANSDYKKRTESAEVIDRRNTAYVGVSLRRFRERKEWCEKKEQEGVWREVRFYDVDDLSEWLDQFQILSYQFGAKFRLITTAARGVEEWWSNWIADCTSAFGTDWLLAGRDQEASNFAEQLKQQQRTLSITGPPLAESIGFIYSSIRALPEAEAEYLFARTIYVPSLESIIEIGARVQDAILIPGCDLDSEHQGLIDRSNKILFCGSPQRFRGSIDIPKINARVLFERMSRDEIPYEIALKASKAGRSSVELLRKELGATPSPFDLPALDSEGTALLSGCMLVNRWESTNANDIAIIGRISGKSTDSIEDFLITLRDVRNPILRISGPVWFLTDDGLAWSQRGSRITQSILQSFQTVAKEVLTESDPRFALEPSERWKAALYGLTQAYSYHIKQGIGRTLAILSEWDGSVAGYLSGQGVVNDIVRACVEVADPVQWFSLGPVLSLLAEASPTVFLTALERDLSSSSPESVAGLFAGTDDALTGGSRHYELLWALERLAWNSHYLLRVTKAMCRLFELGVGAKNGNNPLSSLHQIYLSWNPSTSARVEERLEVLRDIHAAYPEASWQLLVSLLPKDHEVSRSTSRPQIREWASEDARPTRTEIGTFNDQIIRWAIEAAGQDPDRLKELVGALAGYPDPYFGLIIDSVRDASTSISDSEKHQAIWKEMRQRLTLHQRHAGQHWAMPQDHRQLYESVMGLYESANPVTRSLWLFDQWVDLPGARENFKGRDRKLLMLRNEAIKLIVDVLGDPGVFELAEQAGQPSLVGMHVAKIHLWNASKENQFLAEYLASPLPWGRSLAFGYASERYRSKGFDWIVKKLKSAGTQSWFYEQRVDLYLCSRPDQMTWALLSAEPKSVVDSYWSQISVWAVNPETAEDRQLVVANLLQASREQDTIHWLAGATYGGGDSAESELMLEALISLSQRPTPEKLNVQMLAHDVARLLEYVAGQEAIDQTEVARLEFFFMPLVHYEYRPKAISRGLAQDVNFLFELVQLAYDGDEAEKLPPSDEERALALTADELLDAWHDIPGLGEDNLIDESVFLAWVDQVWKTACEREYKRGISYALGHLFVTAPPDKEGVWPQEPMCKAIEHIAFDGLDRHIYIERRNARGVTTRMPDAGGYLERVEEAKYRAYARARQQYPRVEKILADLAASYQVEAVQEDQRADMHQDL